MRSRDYKDYIIVTKKPNYSIHGDGHFSVPKSIQDLTVEENDKTFWLFTKKGELVGRYSVDSAPKWIMSVYEMIVK